MSSNQAQLLHALANKSLHPNPTWLSTFLTSSNPTTSLAALTSTASYRILASDIRTSLSTSPAHTLPQDIASPNMQERKLPNAVVLQVIDLLDIGTSLSSQIENWEMAARGETRGSGRGVVVRIPAEEDDDAEGAGPSNASSEGKGVWKLLLQDAKDNIIWALDVDGILNVDAGFTAVTGRGQNVVGVGSKIALQKNALIARGVLMLERDKINVLGGKIDAIEKDWREGRLARLKEMMPQTA